MAQLEKFKLSANVWESDKDPKGFNLWVENMGSLVRATEHGLPLEHMLDSKLRRQPLVTQSVPSFLLEDPDFAPPAAAPAEPNVTGAASSATVDDNVSSGSLFTSGQHSIRYSDLSEDTKQLDALLYNVLRMNIRGSKVSLLSSVTFPSYVQAILILDKHMSISKMDRIVTAFTAMDKLTYSGDALKFQTESLSLKKELDLCGANMTHYFMCRIMKAFDGKSKTVQFEIASDFNNETIDSNLNIYDLVQKYCSLLASVGDGTSKQVSIVCHHCNGPHKKNDCPKLKAEKATAAKKKQNEFKKKKKSLKDAKKKPKEGDEVVCYGCGEKGHIKPNCPHAKEGSSSAPASAAGQISMAANSTVPTDTARLSPMQLQQVLQAMQGNSKCQVAREVKPSSPDTEDEHIVLSLCDGMGTILHVLEKLKVPVTRYIGVEIDATVRTLSDNLNEPEQSRCGGVDHSWHCDVMNVTREDI